MLGSRLHSIFPVCYTYARIQELHPLLKRFIVRSTSCNQDNLLTEKSLVGVPESSIYVAQRPSIPLITKREIEFPNRYREPKQAWLESLDTLQDEKLGLVDLHPDIFGTYPRIDILHANILWQRWYKKIDYAFVRSRAEMPGGGRKPRPQKKTGLKRQGSIRSPLWRGGGAAFGPRGPQSFYYMLPMSIRTLGLRVALSVKYAQNDLHIVNSLDIPSDDPKFIEDLIDTRFWGFSALFVDDIDIMPRNISLALKELPQFNLMPVYGLNVYSMLKHETLVLTLAAVEKLEKKLLAQMHKPENDVAYKKRH
ncbi:hypothetical protein CHS0354_032936 [Potamilus streckersoni]|uniref:Large ribosomal subunit protein uL4m n=1 Tax=Potamilus streckersoni TaxID=2493646 RepID=A0AAE0VK60_9BIVA|nr:hypothetical protein CHS0354_032936 [Potamilus streckersoni]